VPSGLTNYPNGIPATETLPASFYLAAHPSPLWWGGSIAWPPIGPDVTFGGVGGHAGSIPASLCFGSLAVDPEYADDPPLYPGGSRVRVFNANFQFCYPFQP
jgi:hypothetical protein